ncbi:AAA family ATPase [Lysinibacillus xylanilyticus]|uniref:AAA family ATPase n=1 Tax=Lysinibacillus xylanilyticus TaxID=582475 RepID=UPI003D013F31
MLVNFRFGNYLSYNDLAEFSMVAGKTRLHPKHLMKYNDVSLLKFAALYGANASGKSNLVKAIGFSRQLIIKGFQSSVTYDKYCRIFQENKEELTNFEYEIIIANNIYAYGFSINLFEKKVHREWLYSLSNNKEEVIFIRELKGNSNNFEVNYDFLRLTETDRARFDVYLEDSKELSDSLFITEINKNKKRFVNNRRLSILNMLYLWFWRKLEVISPDEAPIENGITYLRKDKGIGLANFLDAFGTGVKEICTKEIDQKELFKELPPNIVKKILEDFKNDSDNNRAHLRTPDNIHELEKRDGDVVVNVVNFKHSIDDIFYSLGEESDGTVRLVEIYDILASTNEKVFVVDEIDRSLHPNLTYNLIKTYLQKRNKGQLIVTTHEDRLLDLEMLRRDEIWFVEKQENGESNLYSLEKYKERFDRDVLKAYLDGRYGSIPEFKVLTDSELNM